MRRLRLPGPGFCFDDFRLRFRCRLRMGVLGIGLGGFSRLARKFFLRRVRLVAFLVHLLRGRPHHPSPKRRLPACLVSGLPCCIPGWTALRRAGEEELVHDRYPYMVADMDSFSALSIWLGCRLRRGVVFWCSLARARSLVSCSLEWTATLGLVFTSSLLSWQAPLSASPLKVSAFRKQPPYPQRKPRSCLPLVRWLQT